MSASSFPPSSSYLVLGRLEKHRLFEGWTESPSAGIGGATLEHSQVFVAATSPPFCLRFLSIFDALNFCLTSLTFFFGVYLIFCAAKLVCFACVLIAQNAVHLEFSKI